MLSLVIHCVALGPTLLCLLLISKEAAPSSPELQIFRHFLLLLTMATTMFTSIALSISSLSLSKGSYPGTFKVLIITDSIFSSGQGIFILAIFGLTP